VILNLMRYVAVSYSGAGALAIKDDVPGSTMTTVATVTLSNQAERNEVRFQLPMDARGFNIRVRFTPDGGSTLRPFSCRLFCKALGGEPSAWRWVSLPIPAPSEDWQEIELPIPPTTDDWQEITLPIPPTTDDWQEITIPLPATPEDWQEIPIVAGTDGKWQFVDMPSGEAS